MAAGLGPCENSSATIIHGIDPGMENIQSRTDTLNSRKGASECMVLNAKMINLSAISWRELVTFYGMIIM
jgi:hypothetical protein